MISIIVPVYNAESFLNDCIESLIRQTIEEIEIILIDDGSKDGSLSICKQFACKDKRIRYYTQENAGVSMARNRGLQEATGEWICFIDSDDIIAQDYLQNLRDMANDGVLAICGYTREKELLGEKETTRKEYTVKDYIIQIFDESVTHPNIWMMLFSNNIIQKNNIRFTPGCARNEDTEFYIKYMTFVKSIVVSDYKGYFYRNNPNSAMHILNRKSLTSIEASQRISDLLVKKGFMTPENLTVPASVQVFVYRSARQNNKEIYNLVHSLYDVRMMMKKMVKHQKITRKGLAILYLCLGKSYFFQIFS